MYHQISKNELYKALETITSNLIPVISDGFQCFKNEAYHEQFNGINLSSLFTLLIREAAKHTENYTSDIFYDMQKLWEDLKGETTALYNQEAYDNAIGIRDMGTDGEEFILTRNAGICDTFAYLYKRFFYIRIRSDGNSKTWKVMQVFSIEPKELDNYFQKEREAYLK